MKSLPYVILTLLLSISASLFFVYIYYYKPVMESGSLEHATTLAAILAPLFSGMFAVEALNISKDRRLDTDGLQLTMYVGYFFVLLYPYTILVSYVPLWTITCINIAKRIIGVNYGTFSDSM